MAHYLSVELGGSGHMRIYEEETASSSCCSGPSTYRVVCLREAIRCANTPAVARNIFAYDEKIILVLSYSKASTNHNNSFLVVRRPCPAVKRILFIYLAYGRPSADFLYRELQEDTRVSQNLHLFTRHDWDSACFSLDACLRSLQKSTEDSPILLTTRNYRHIAVAMSKRHIPDLLKPFDAHVPQDYDGFLRLLAFQTGHKPETRANAYALEIAFPAKLQPDLIRRYLENSRVWHDFLLRAKATSLRPL